VYFYLLDDAEYQLAAHSHVVRCVYVHITYMPMRGDKLWREDPLRPRVVIEYYYYCFEATSN
jgi:hypothetical protein